MLGVTPGATIQGRAHKMGPMTTSTDYSAASSPSELFFENFRRHSSGVAIVTLRKSSGDPTGFTATSVTSLSAVPPRATFNMSQFASSYPAIRSSQHLLIHFLTSDHVELATQFSGDSAGRFAGIDLLDGPEGLPLIPGTAGYVVGKIVARHETGDAVTVVVEIVGGGLGQPGEGLVYQEKSYRAAASLD
jgi:flavin reductase (DIM6/NTAB) family NADH-FMN oxidoreductase RutF